MQYKNIAPTDNFCRCNNCEDVLFDMNPQVYAKEYTCDTFPEAKSMVWSKEEFAYVCPNCLTDEYLTDL